MENNAYFDEMYRIGREWSLAHRAHEELKEKIIKERGWESKELDAWREEEAQMKYPFSSGANKAYRAWKYSEGDELIMDDFCWDRERHDFIEALRQAGIQTFVVTNQSTGLMEDLHGYVAEGCTMLGLHTFTRVKESFGEKIEEQVQGIRFSL